MIINGVIVTSSSLSMTYFWLVQMAQFFWRFLSTGFLSLRISTTQYHPHKTNYLFPLDSLHLLLFFWPMETSITNLGPSLLTISFNLAFCISSFNSDCGFTSLLHTSPPPNVARFLEVPLIYGKEHCSFPVSKKAYYHKVIRYTYDFNIIKPSDGFTLFTNSFNIKKIYSLPMECIYVFCMDCKTNNVYFPQRKLIHWFLELGRRNLIFIYNSG